jgi:hypothetical protein
MEARRARPIEEGAARLLARARERSSWAEVWADEDDAGVYHFALLSADDADVLVEVGAKAGPRSRAVTALRFDAIHVDVASGRIAIATHHPRDVRALATILGEALFGDPHFFSERPAFTTRPFESLVASGSSFTLPAPITRMRVIAGTKERITEGRVRADGPRALALLEESARLAGGYLPETTLRFDLAGEDLPVDVDVRLPWRFWCSTPKHEPLARRAMDAIGMFAPGARPDDAWSLFPVKHGAWRLRESLGDAEVEALTKAKVLRREVSRNVTARELRAHGTNYVTFPVPGEPGVHYAIASDPSVPTRDVTEKDREVLELDVKKLAALRAKQMRLAGEPRLGADGAVVRLGVLAASTTTLAFTALLRAPSGDDERAALVKEIKDAAFPGHAVLLVPRGRAWNSGLFEVEYDGLVAGGAKLTWAGVKLARLADEIDVSALSDAPLVIHRATRRAWLFGTALALADSGYVMLEGLALRPDRFSTGREVSAWLSPARAAREDTSAAKATKLKLVRWMIESFETAGKKVPTREIEKVIVAEVKKGYRLGVGVEVF